MHKSCKNLNSNNVVICAEPYHCSTEKSIFLTNLFHEKGADIVSLIFGEKYYSDFQVYKHFKAVHENTKDIFFYTNKFWKTEQS